MRHMGIWKSILDKTIHRREVKSTVGIFIIIMSNAVTDLSAGKDKFSFSKAILGGVKIADIIPFPDGKKKSALEKNNRDLDSHLKSMNRWNERKQEAEAKVNNEGKILYAEAKVLYDEAKDLKAAGEIREAKRKIRKADAKIKRAKRYEEDVAHCKREALKYKGLAGVDGYGFIDIHGDFPISKRDVGKIFKEFDKVLR